MKSQIQRLRIIEWLLGAGVTIVAVIAWAIDRRIGVQAPSIYDIFPLFGLLAFSLMWTHFVCGAIRRLMKIEKKGSDLYWSVSSGLVLAAIILHPLLLNVALIRDGFGLPPADYFAAYQSLGWFLVLGTAALLVFLAFELRRWLGRERWWKWVEFAQIPAMIAIFIHSLVLGRELTTPWFMAIWWLYGVSLTAAWVYTYSYDRRKAGR